MPFAQLMAVLPPRDVACSLRVPSNSNDLKCNKDENETVIAHRSDCGLFLSQNQINQQPACRGSFFEILPSFYTVPVEDFTFRFYT